MADNKHTKGDLQQMQAVPLAGKILMTKRRIRDGTTTAELAQLSGRKHQNVRFAIWKAIRNGGRFGCYEVVRLEEGE